MALPLDKVDFADLFNVNAEPAVAEVQQEIMSQAKISEAIRDAQDEAYRRELHQELADEKQREQEQEQ